MGKLGWRLDDGGVAAAAVEATVASEVRRVAALLVGCGGGGDRVAFVPLLVAILVAIGSRFDDSKRVVRCFEACGRIQSARNSIVHPLGRPSFRWLD